MMGETAMIDRLFLELSHVTKAKTQRELLLEGLLMDVNGAVGNGAPSLYREALSQDLRDRIEAALGFMKH